MLFVKLIKAVRSLESDMSHQSLPPHNWQSRMKAMIKSTIGGATTGTRLPSMANP
jgi:hypothetical protein